MTGRAVLLSRALVGATGVALLAFGTWQLATTQSLELLGWLAVWAAGAIVANDLVLLPIAQAAGVAVRRGATAVGLPRTARLLCAGTPAVGGVLTLLAVPLLVARARGPANDSILATDVGAALAVAWAALAGIALVGSIVAAVLARRGRG